MKNQKTKTKKIRKPKYKLTSETLSIDGRTLYRIIACKSFTTSVGITVNAGDLGGWVEDTSNLSQKGNAWIFDEAKVSGGSNVCQNAVIRDNAAILNFSLIKGKAVIAGDAVIKKRSIVGGKSTVCASATVENGSEVSGHTYVCQDVTIADCAVISGSALIHGEGRICTCNAKLYGVVEIGK